jgi:hypothetical protein
MDGTKLMKKTRVSTGDLAVDGIFTGLEAGIVMAVFLVVVAVGQRTSPSDVLAAFTLQGAPSLISGVLTHLAVSCVYGIIFSLVMHLLFRDSSGTTPG